MCQDLDSHDIRIDEREGIEVCVKCGYVASNQLFMMDRKPVIPSTSKCLYYHFILEPCFLPSPSKLQLPECQILLLFLIST